MNTQEITKELGYVALRLAFADKDADKDVVMIAIARLEQLEKALEAQQWKPIESAPKDGSKILLASLGYAMNWDEGCVLEDKALSVGWASSGFWSKQFNKFWDGSEPCGFANLTHWQPLPTPPAS